MSVHYDPLLAKVIASAETRDAAIARASRRCASSPILGIRTNIPFLLAILEHPRFVAGDIDTGFLDRESATRSPRRSRPSRRRVAAARLPRRRSRAGARGAGTPCAIRSTRSRAGG